MKLKPEMFADVEIQAPAGESHELVPRDAVIDIGAARADRRRRAARRVCLRR